MSARDGPPRVPLGRRLLSVLAVAILMSSLATVVVRATVAAVGFTAVENVAGTANADHRVTFTSSANTDATGIDVTFPAGYTVAAPGAAGISSTGCSGSAAGEICVNGTRVVVAGATASGRTVSITFGARDLTVGTVQFTITAGITNPQTAGTLAAAGFTVATTSATTNAEAAVAAGADVTIVAAPPEHVAVSGPATVTAGSTALFTVTITDRYGNLSTVNGSRLFGLSSDAGGTFRNAADTTTITEVAVTNGTHTAQFRYRDTVAGSPTITVTQTSGNPLTTGSDTAAITVEPAAPVQVIVSGPASVAPATSSTPFTVALQDQFGNASAVTTDTVFGLSSDSAGDTFRDAADAVVITEVTVADGASSAQFRYRDTVAGSPTITVSRLSGEVLNVSSDTVVIDVTADTADAAISTLAASSTAVTGSGPVTVTATLRNAATDPVTGSSVELQASGGTATITPATATSDASGVATFSVSATPDVSITFSATEVDSGIAVTQTVTVSFQAPPPPAPAPAGGDTDEGPRGRRRTATTDPDGAGATPAVPVHGTITAPDAGDVTITRGAVTAPLPHGFARVGSDLDVGAPTATAGAPLVLELRVDGSMVPDGAFVGAFGDGVPTPPCDVADATTAAPDPCISGRATSDDDTVLTVLASRGAAWAVGVLPRASIALVCPDPTPKAGFQDVPDDATHGAAIDCAARQGMAVGVTARTFSPEVLVTRAQMATFVARLLEAAGVDLPTGDTSSFAAGDAGLHADNIDRLAAAGIVSGRTATAYDPAGWITREQLATFLVGAFEYATGREVPETPTRFTDADGIHASNVRRLVGLGITVGVTDERYAPREAVPRGQMASFLSRVLNRLAAEGVRPS